MTFRPPLRALQAAFWLAAAIAAAGALWPDPPTPEVSNLDKAVHFTTFYVLELLALLAFPSVRRILPLIGLIGFGGLIEVAQGVVGRDASWWDLLADASGAAAALLPFVIARRVRPQA